ncbi:MAG: small subunit ribosomal protein, partial [Solirubrobacteraceae bacterium]|nr:small subunit ribosomal protein [Solirubrobacteraceae bacterium]
APAAEVEAPAAEVEAPAAEVEAPAAEVEAPAAEEAPEPEVEEAPAAAAEAPAEEAGEPAPVLTKKEQRTAARHAVTSKRPSRTPEERNAERLAERTRKAAARRRRREKAKTARAGAERGPAKTASTAEHGPGRPKVRQGLVVSDKADKTITVRVDSARRHRRYEKVVRSSSTLHAHDEANDANEGDLVQIMESRPLSRLKRWRLVEVLERAK